MLIMQMIARPDGTPPLITDRVLAAVGSDTGPFYGAMDQWKSGSAIPTLESSRIEISVSPTLISGANFASVPASLKATVAHFVERGMIVVHDLVTVKNLTGNEVRAFDSVLENDSDFISIDLSVARAAPGVELLYNAASISGRSISVWETDGDSSIKFNLTTEEENPIYPITYPGQVNFVRNFTRIYLVNAAQLGKVLRVYVGKWSG